MLLQHQRIILFTMNDLVRPIRLGNIYGRNKSTSFAGNVWDADFISPALTTMQGGVESQ